jgi:hypothetical protein
MRDAAASPAMSETPSPTASLANFSLRGKKPGLRHNKGGDLTERIAVAPAPAPAASPAPTPPPSRPPASAEPPPRSEEIVVYWERVRRGRPLPPLADIDRSLVANAWPDSLIVLFDQDPAAMPRISRLGESAGEIEYTPMVTDWILSRARHAAKRAARHDETQSFPIEGDVPRYRLFLLPLGSQSGGSEAVLCHLCRTS